MEGSGREGSEATGRLPPWSRGGPELAAKETHLGWGGGPQMTINLSGLKHNSLTVVDIRRSKIKVSVGLRSSWRLQRGICLLAFSSF